MKKRKISNLLKYIVLLLLLIFLLFPIYWVFVTSFKSNMEAYKYPPSFLPIEPTINSYIKLFTVNNDFFVYYRNNFIVSGITALITTTMAIFSGYALSRFKIKWNKWILAALLSSQMFPVVSRMISLYDLLGDAGLINTLPGLIMALIADVLPFTVLLMMSFFEGVPKAIEEAAYIDGCSRTQILFRIVTPLVKPGMLAVFLYSLLLTWDDYLHAATIIQNDNLRTLSVGVALRYLGELSYDWSLINTISIIGMLPMILLFFFFQKYMVKGLVAGAVKG
ncbi:MAG: carbohydrate ABC transporter permease [Bacillota bacterium]|jgi:multiple sugar transport system permease protein